MAIQGTPNADILYGTLVSDDILGLGGNDTLWGYAGDDYLNGGSGSDTMYGGVGDDVYIVDNVGDTVIEYAYEGVDRVYSTLRNYTLGLYVENLSLSTNLSDFAYNGSGNNLNNTIKGNFRNNNLYGYGGNDILWGYDGNDYLNGGRGGDTMYGGKHDDTYVVDSTADKVIEYAYEGVDEVYSTLANYTLGLYVENLSLSTNHSDFAYNGYGNSLNNTIEGNFRNNSLYGYGGNDTLWGYDGSDYLNGGSGGDTMYGGRYDDTYVVDNTGDRVIEYSYEGVDTVITTLDRYQLSLDYYVENLKLEGSIAKTAFGNDIDNVMEGNSQDNNFFGWGGNDTLIGGAGSDGLNGDTGNDTLIGYGGATGEYDILWGDSQADTFVLGQNSVFYQGAGYARIMDFKRFEGDKVQLLGSSSNYTLDKTQNWDGTSALDTLIKHNGDVIGVVRDTTNFSLSLDTVWV